MLALYHFLHLALQSLHRNRVQTVLAMLGVMVGVAALVTSIALGRGAQEAITDQLQAAGVNMLVVTAGNYESRRSSNSGGVEAYHGSLYRPERGYGIAGSGARPGMVKSDSTTARPSYRPDTLVGAPSGFPFGARLIKAHFEDDPMAEHDHPTAQERLGDSMAGLGAAATLSLEDAEEIRKLPGVKAVVSGVHENARVSVEGQTQKWFTRLHGTESDLPEMRRGWTFPFGRFLSPDEVTNNSQVMVLGKVAADRLFGEATNPVGETVILWNQPFEVVGVVDSGSWATQPVAGDDQFDAVYVPVTTVHQLLNLSKLNTITVTTVKSGETTQVAREIVTLLRQRHGITAEMPDDFTVRTQAQQLLGRGLSPDIARVVSGNLGSVDELTIENLASSLQGANRTMLALLAGVATVSLLVGGIGVMNLLLLSVTQRTREVGLRISLGARRSDIATQFIIEAVLLSVIGGILGAGLGVVASASLEGIFDWSTAFSPLSMVLAIFVAAVLGVLSGVYPARRAAELNPIGALHHE